MKSPFSKPLSLVLSILLLACLSAQAGIDKKSTSKHGSKPALVRTNAQAYAIPSGPMAVSSTGQTQQGRLPLGTLGVSAIGTSPGVIVGRTYYDYQQNGSIGRMIETGPYPGSAGLTGVHFSWMFLPDAILQNRSYGYNFFNSGNHTFSGVYLTDYEENGGYVNVDVTPDNRGLVGGHADDSKGAVTYQPQIYIDECPGCETFSLYSRVPDSLSVFEQVDGNEATWPKFFFQVGADTVLHIAALNDAGDYMTLMYFRMVGYEGEGQWSYPPYVVDTVSVIGQDITGEKQGSRVALTWFAHPPYDDPWCDTCSATNSPYDFTLIGQMDNDVYVQISENQGITWEPRDNITEVPIGEAAWKPYCDASLLFDQSGYLHVVWGASPWPADPELDGTFEDDWQGVEARLFHWSENVPYIRTICDHNYPAGDSCAPGSWALNVAKPTISECDNKLYVIWTQFNDIPNGIDNDCAAWGYPDQYWGAANGDLWVSVSSDGGMFWDAQRNLTNSITPHCEAGECQSDYWASMSRYGRQVQPGEDWSPATIVDPTSGASPTGYYLDIQFVNDLDAGAVVQAEGSWTYNDIKWFRMPCFEPSWNPWWCLSYSWGGLEESTPVGVQKDVPLVLENVGSSELHYTMTVEEDNGPEGWLAVSDFSGTVPAGLTDTETGTVHLNYNGICTTNSYLTGRLILTFESDCAPDTLSVNLFVVEPDVFLVWDTVHTSCLALTCSPHGNMGRQGIGKVNMDYYPEDCDSTAQIYMYDGSPVIGRVIGDDTVFNSAIFGVSWYDENGFRPQGGTTPAGYCTSLNAEVYQTGTFATDDSSIALNRVYIAPKDNCPFIIEYTKVYSFDGAAHDDVMIGEVIDWDVPWDFLEDNTYHYSVNSGGIDPYRKLIYQQGYESPTDGDEYPFDCQLNSERFAGYAFVQSYLNGELFSLGPYSGFVGEFDSLTGLGGLVAGDLFAEMIQTGFRSTDSLEDLVSVMCFHPYLDLGADDYYEVVTVLATVHQGSLSDLQSTVELGRDWYQAHGGMDMFADEDGNGRIDICTFTCCEIAGDLNGDNMADPLDIVYMVNWFWKGGPGPECCASADLNCDCHVDPLDLNLFVGWLWKYWPEPCNACLMECWEDIGGPPCP